MLNLRHNKGGLLVLASRQGLGSSLSILPKHAPLQTTPASPCIPDISDLFYLLHSYTPLSQNFSPTIDQSFTRSTQPFHTNYFILKHSLHYSVLIYSFYVSILSHRAVIYSHYFIYSFTNTNKLFYFFILYSITSPYSTHCSKVIHLCHPYSRPPSLLLYSYYSFTSIHQS